jgi:hypothetical protein
VGLWVDGTGRRTDDQATQALLGVYLHEIERPEQMLQAPPPRPEFVPNNELPKDLNDPHARSEDSRKSRASFNSDPTRQDARFRIFQAMSAKFGSSLLGLIKLIKLMDSSSYTVPWQRWCYTAGFTTFPSFVASGAKIPYLECTKYVRITLSPFSNTQLTQENHGQS